MHQRIVRFGLLAAAALAWSACGDSTAPPPPPVMTRLRVEAVGDFAQPAQVVGEVTAADLDSAVGFSLTPTYVAIDGWHASATVAVLEGARRTFTLRGLDGDGVETHRGSVTIDVHDRGTPPVTVTLTPLGGGTPITVRIGNVFVSVMPPALSLLPGDTAHLNAAVLDADSSALDLPVQWSSSNASVLRVDSTGLVTAVAAGTAYAVATAAGSTGSGQILVLVALDLAEERLAPAYVKWEQLLAYEGPTLLLSTAAFEHSAPWTNGGMEYYSRIPRVATANASSGEFSANLVSAWRRSYEALTRARDGLSALEGRDDALTPRGLRARAYGKYVQGLALGTVAVLYDSGFVYDETTARDTVHLYGHADVMEAALAHLTEAADLAAQWGAAGGPATIPAAWMSRDVSPAVLARLAHSEMARMRAAVARTPAERAAVDWSAVAADAAAGVTADWLLVAPCDGFSFCDDGVQYRTQHGWAMTGNWVMGMADQSGNYQAWMAAPVDARQPLVFETPDTRFPQGADEATQLDSRGSMIEVAAGADRIWNRPDRGTWRWSYYRNWDWDVWMYSGGTPPPLVSVRELRLLQAEAAYRAGDAAQASTIVNETRTAHGLQATDAGGTNADCVPKLPDGSCGGLWEMLKWEKRLETQFRGTLRVGWYLDGRGWGDLMEGTVLQFPVPYFVMTSLGRAPYDYGGVGGQWGAPVGTYGY